MWLRYTETASHAHRLRPCLSPARRQFCVRGGIPVISALGAGGKAHAGQLHVARLAEVYNDPIGTSLLKRFKAAKAGEGGKGGKGGKNGKDEKAIEGAKTTKEGAKIRATKADEVGAAGEGGAVVVKGGEGGKAAGAPSGADEGDGWWWLDLPNQVWVVYSSELQKVSLLPLPKGVAAEELG